MLAWCRSTCHHAGDTVPGIAADVIPLGVGQMTIAMVTQRLKAMRRTKLYDLFAAAPLIAWYLFCAAHLLPTVAQQIALIKLFVQTDPSVLPAGLILSTLSRVAALGFFAVLVVMFAVRHVPQRTLSGVYPRCAAVAGTFLSVSFLLLPLQELSSVLYLASLILMISGFVFAIWVGLVLGRSISILPGSSATCDLGALSLRPPSTLPWRDRCHRWSCASVLFGMGAVAAGAATRNPTSAHEIRGTGSISGLSRIWRLHGADGPFSAGSVLERAIA